MATWLFSTEPDSYPWQKVEQEKKVRWDGIRGNAAQKHMRGIRPGDVILAYHSAPEKAVVGIAEAASASYPDPSVPAEERDRWHVIDVAWKKWLPHPVPLKIMRQTRALAKMKFVILPRLSVSPVSDEEWATIRSLAEQAHAVG
jgi:predicted RNA-binding protein with PUA-like domain